MRVDMIRGSMAAPEAMMHIMSDYHRSGGSGGPYDSRAPPPSMLDIGLDLPPPAAVMRRSVVPQQHAYDMGPLLPGVQVCVGGGGRGKGGRGRCFRGCKCVGVGGERKGQERRGEVQVVGVARAIVRMGLIWAAHTPHSHPLLSCCSHALSVAPFPILLTHPLSSPLPTPPPSPRCITPCRTNPRCTLDRRQYCRMGRRDHPPRYVGGEGAYQCCRMDLFGQPPRCRGGGGGEEGGVLWGTNRDISRMRAPLYARLV